MSVPTEGLGRVDEVMGWRGKGRLPGDPGQTGTMAWPKAESYLRGRSDHIWRLGRRLMNDRI